MSEIAKLESEIKEYKLQLETLQPALRDDPENAEFLSLSSELEELISILEGNLAELRPAAAPKETPKEKWSKENHPAYQAGYRKPEEEKVTFSINDNVLAKWKSGDKGMHQAKIISITGSSSKPIYTVRFKAGNETETVYQHDLKALAFETSKKRKADSLPASPSIQTTASNPGVISAAANVDADLVSQVRSDASKNFDAPKPTKIARKVKANKELEAGKSKWQDFKAKGKFPKAGKKESMFRTGDGVNARVGFVGSGQDMRKDAARKRHIYQDDGGEDDA